MALLKSPYELSLWGDYYNSTSGSFDEKRKGIIGSNTMTQEWRAQNVQLIKNVNGSKTLTFTMYNKYIDNLSGEEVFNPYTSLTDGIKNEDKLKLKYKNKWYDFIIKNITEDSSTQSYSYSATDLFINELSKNGFDVTLDTKLLNNYGTVTDLGMKVLENTDWSIDEENSDVCIQTKNEFLALVQIPCDKYVYPLNDPQDESRYKSEDGQLIDKTAYEELTADERKDYELCERWSGTSKGDSITLESVRQSKIQEFIGTDTTVEAQTNSIYALAFYSSCTTKPRVFQFIYIPGLDADGTISGSYKYNSDSGTDLTGYYSDWSKVLIDDDGNIINKNCQYFIECSEEGYADSQGYYLPSGCIFTKLIPSKKANRYVISIENQFLPGLGKYVEVCTKANDSTQTIYHYSEEEFVPPNLIKNCVGNNSFKNTSGWTGAFYSSDKAEMVNGSYETYAASTGQELGRVSISATVFPDPVDEFKSLGPASSTAEVISKIKQKEYAPRLKIEHTSPLDFKPSNPDEGETTWAQRFNDLTPVLIEQGFYSQRTSLSDIFCRKGQGGGSADAEDNERNQLVFAWIAKTKDIDSTTGEMVETLLDSKDELVAHFTKITIEDARYDIDSGRYANFNTANKVNLTEICAELDLTDSETIIYTKEVDVGQKAVLDDNGEPIKNADGSLQIAKTSKTYCYAIVELKHNYTTSQYEAASMRTMIHLASIAAPTYKKIGTGTIVNADDYKNLSVDEKKQYEKVPSTPFYLEDFQIFEYYPNNEANPIFPCEVDASGVNKESHWYFSDSNLTLEELKDGGDGTTCLTQKDEENFPPRLDYTSEKKRVIDAKESNCFNIIQTLAEQFECWADFSISRDSITGKIIPGGKKIKFKNYIGKDNYAGIQYGVNLKQVQRTNVSDALVTKMIVKMNSNEHAEDGFCSVARAKSNPTKESFLLDFSYYFKQGLMGEGIGEEEFLEDMYLDVNNQSLSGKTPHGKDVNASDQTWDHFGLYDRLNKLNTDLTTNNQTLLNKQKELLEAETTYDLAVKAAAAAVAEFESAYNRFTDLTGPNPFVDIVSEITGTTPSTADDEEDNNSRTWGELLENSSEIRHYFYAMVQAEAVQAEQKALEDTNKILVDELKTAISGLEAQNDTIRTNKTELLKSFYTKYSRFIQEGTWTDEKYSDDELYYLDAQQTLYNSCWPQVEYTINALTVDMMPGYEHYNFEVGDKTWVQDTEFFGTNSDGTPYKKEVIISETTNNLDSPDKDTFKVQTFKNQFQDLFKKVTATVQSVQFSEGSYNRAAQLAAADTAGKNEFLKDALNSVAMQVSNARNQSVVMNENGITITNTQAPNEALRLTSGAILFQRNNSNGELEWKTGLTANGISADYITAGQIDTAVIQIMNGNETSFRWDAHGLTAYDFVESNNGRSTQVSNTRGVTFNRFGIYGIDLTGSGDNLLTWYPKAIDEVLDKASFSLTWDGLKILDTTENGQVRIGRHVYKSEGVDKTALIRVLDKDNNDTFRVDSDGSVYIQTELDIGDYMKSNTFSEGSIPEGQNFAWLFSTTEGMSMQAKKSDESANEVFSIKSDGKGNYVLTMKGRVEAEEGYIGKWTISESGLLYGAKEETGYLLYAQGEQIEQNLTERQHVFGSETLILKSNQVSNSQAFDEFGAPYSKESIRFTFTPTRRKWAKQGTIRITFYQPLDQNATELWLNSSNGYEATQDARLWLGAHDDKRSLWTTYTDFNWDQNTSASVAAKIDSDGILKITVTYQWKSGPYEYLTGPLQSWINNNNWLDVYGACNFSCVIDYIDCNTTIDCLSSIDSTGRLKVNSIDLSAISPDYPLILDEKTIPKLYSLLQIDIAT